MGALQERRRETSMRVSFEPERLKQALNRDPEFRLTARYWDGALELDVGEEAYVIALSAGQVTSVSHDASSRGQPGHVIISAPVEDWSKLLQDPPPPFYHDFYPAVCWHSFRYGGDPDYLWAYYAAVRRTAEILRANADVAGD
jgi:hypothetical protein